MSLPIKLISTDFDGTLHSGFEDPPIPRDIDRLISHLQACGAKWIINTGRDLTSLMEALTASRLSCRPDYVVVVEREIYKCEEHDMVAVDEWNTACKNQHQALFENVRAHLPQLAGWIQSNFKATIYEDDYSPFCLIAENVKDADAIHEYLSVYVQDIPELTVVRNDIYSRFSHVAYNKGTALQEIARRLGIRPDEILAAGDHHNDLPMLSTQYAKFLVCPDNAIDVVKETVRRQNGYISKQTHGYGVARGLEYFLETQGFAY